MIIYAIISQKGGVGKTTTTVNLGAARGPAGQRVLLLDLDPQGSLTLAVGQRARPLSIEHVLREPGAILGAIHPCAGGMQVVTAAATLTGVYMELYKVEASAYRLAQALQLVQERYDYVLIDCPPSLGYATTNALTAAHVALVPLQCEFLSLRGLADVQEIAAVIQETTNPGLRLRVLGTMYDKRTIHTADVLKEARHALPGLVYETVIPRTIRLAEAPATGLPILEYAPDSNGTYAYRMLAQEILQEDSIIGTTRPYSSGHAAAPCVPHAA